MTQPREFHPSVEGILRGWSRFAARARKRLRRGAVVHRRHTYSSDPLERIRELERDCLDVVGLAFLTFEALDQLEHDLRTNEKEEENGA